MNITKDQQWVLFEHPIYGIIAHEVFERRPFSFVVRFDFEVSYRVDICDSIGNASTKEELMKKFPEYFI